jgi:hypothetical protein
LPTQTKSHYFKALKKKTIWLFQAITNYTKIVPLLWKIKMQKSKTQTYLDKKYIIIWYWKKIGCYFGSSLFLFNYFLSKATNMVDCLPLSRRCSSRRRRGLLLLFLFCIIEGRVYAKWVPRVSKLWVFQWFMHHR